MTLSLYTFCMMKFILALGSIIIFGGILAYFIIDVPTTKVKDESVVPELPLAPEVNTTAPQFIGSWRSAEDKNSVVVFNDDGTTVDIYDDQEVARGVWELSPLGATDIPTSDLSLRVTIDNEIYEYTVWEISDTHLVLNYNARGNTLRYTRE